MAPSAVETTTKTEPTLRFHVGSGEYKDLNTITYKKEDELNGGNGFEAAKVTKA